MKTADVLRAWGRILKGEQPSLSIEITKECPLRCPGCYAYGEHHLGVGTGLRALNDLRGQELIDGVLSLVDRHRPLHVSLVGGDPLVRYRECNVLVPALIGRGIHVQIVTSAFREMVPEWAQMEALNVVVSIDGLQPEHDARRAPATYARILKNIASQKVTIHCTVTGQIMKRPGYLREFVEFWSQRPEVKKMWFSLFTPQRGDSLPEMLSATERAVAIETLLRLREEFQKLDMPAALIKQFATPPSHPHECIFALTTQTISADLQTKVTPCQFGGDPDCSSCGCIASMGLAAVGDRRLAGVIPVRSIFEISSRLGRARAGNTAAPQPADKSQADLLKVLR